MTHLQQLKKTAATSLCLINLLGIIEGIFDYLTPFLEKTIAGLLVQDSGLLVD